MAMDVEFIAKCLPAQPDEGVKAFVRKNWHELGGFVTIFKRVAGRNVPSLYGEPQAGYFAECWCSECGETWHTAWGGDKSLIVADGDASMIYPISPDAAAYGPDLVSRINDGNAGICPMCGEVITFRHSSKFGARQMTRRHFLVFRNILGYTALVSWLAYREIFPDHSQWFEIVPWVANVIDEQGRLLAMPEGQAEALTAEHDPQSMTVRDLKRQIAEYKDRLEKAADAGAAQQQLLLLATEENGALKQRLEGIDEDYQAQLLEVDRENDQLRADLEAAKNRPAEISGEDAEKLRAEGAAKAHAEHAEQEQALAENVRRLKMELQSTADAAGKASAEKDERIRELERQLSAAAPGANADLMKNEVLTVLAEAQAALNKMHGCYLKSQAGAPKLADAIKAQAEKLIASLHSNFGIEYI